MSAHKDRGHHRDHNASPPGASRKPPHKDWRLWLAVLLMLAAMMTYVMTMDEAIPPGGAVGQPIPAAP